MGTHIEGSIFGDSYKRAMYGESYIGYNKWRLIHGVERMEIHV